ncbi:unnamed protein product [Larinioides sclopetarius]|uniref:Uncharacterized protein n=1 Tax=Larinioides sclopetarius TaxID=280406 RepID=A0AAV1ZRT9_9ARAC
MKIGSQASSAKRRLLIFFYLLCSVFTLTPTIMAPPESGFSRGQPELQQAMDNMLAREQMIKKGLQFPTGEIQGYPALLTHKTSYLLSEAEHMLNRVKNLKERRWVEAFVHRLKLLSSVLDQSVFGDHPEAMEGQNFTFGEAAQSLNKAPLEEGPLSPTPSALQESAVRETNQKQQGDKMTSKHPVTLPQTNQVLPKNDYPAERQVVTKPGLLQPLPDKKSEEDDEDELVKELEDLHKMIASDHLQRNATPQKVEPADVEPSTSPEEVSSEAPLKRMGPMNVNELVLEHEKSQIKENLAKEVAELERLGETEEEILSSLHLNDHRFHGSMHPTMFGQKSNVGNVDHVNNGKTFQNVQDVNSDDAMISHINPSIWRPPAAVHPAYNPYKQVYMNNSFPSRHINLAPMNQQLLARQLQNEMVNNPPRTNLQLYHDGIKDTIQKLQKQHQNFLLKNHVPQMPEDPQQNSPNPKPSPPNNKYQANPSLGLHYPDRSGKYIYKPYPYFQNYNPQNLTVPEPQAMVNPFPPNSFSNHKISNELSEEMKRQLRDGKVILLSDSVVRSNFGPDTEKDEEKNPKEATIQEPKAEKKNETQAQK